MRGLKKILSKLGLSLTALALVLSFVPAVLFSGAASADPVGLYSITNPATSLSTTGAILNGTNGAVDATGHSFWVSQATFDTSSPAIPANVYSTPVLPGVGAGVSFSDPLSLVTTNGIIAGGVPGNMPDITPNTTYYFVAWSDIGGTWHPGTVLNFATDAPAPVYVTTDAATPVASTSATLNGTVGTSPVDNTFFWWGTSSAGPFTSATDPSGQLPSGWSYNPTGTGAESAGGSFSDALTGLTPSTPYHFVAWSLVDSTWYPGAVLNFTTNPAPAPILTLTVPATKTITRSALVPETSGVPTAGNAAVNTATAGLIPIAVTLENTGGAASANVRISPIGADSHIQLWAKDTSGSWFDINVTGWIDSAGKSIPANSNPITTNVYAISDVAGSYPLTVNLVQVSNSLVVASTIGTVTVAPIIIHTQADFAAFDGVDIGTNAYTLSSGITATYTGSNTIKLTGYAPIVTPWFGKDWTTYNYVTVGIKLPARFTGAYVYQTGIMRYDVDSAGAYKMSSVGDGSTPLATDGAAKGYLDYSFAANSPNTKKDGLVTLMVIWNVGDAPEYFTIDISSLHLLTPAETAAPRVAITSPTLNQAISGRIVTVKGTATDTDFNYYYCYVSNVNGHEYGVRDASCTTTWHAVTPASVLGSVTLPNDLPDGNYVVHLIGKDKAGNTTEVTQSFILDNTLPTGSVNYTGGNKVSDIIYLKLIDNLNFNAAFTDNQALEHTSYAVWKADGDFQNRVLFCGNWNHAITSVDISSTSDSVSGNVKDCSPTGDWSNGSYVIMHIVYDAAGNATYLNNYPGQKFVIDNTIPVIDLTGSSPMIVEYGSSYSELGAIWTDNYDGSGNAVVSDDVVNTDVLGTYTIKYNYTDTTGNIATEVTRTVNVVDTTKPVIKISGTDPVTVEMGTSYVDAGATALDNYDRDLTSTIVTVNPVDTTTVGIYAVTYNVSDTAGNDAVEVTRTVKVVDTAGNHATPVTPTVTVSPALRTFGGATFVAGAIAPTPTPSVTPTTTPTTIVDSNQTSDDITKVEGVSDTGSNLWWVWVLAALAVGGGLWWILAKRRVGEDE